MKQILSIQFVSNMKQNTWKLYETPCSEEHFPQATKFICLAETKNFKFTSKHVKNRSQTSSVGLLRRRLHLCNILCIVLVLQIERSKFLINTQKKYACMTTNYKKRKL